jgi:hypothetical protein
VLIIENNLCNNYYNIFLSSTCRDFLYKWTSSHRHQEEKTNSQGEQRNKQKLRETQKNPNHILSNKEVVAPCSSFKIKKQSNPSLWRNRDLSLARHCPLSLSSTAHHFPPQPTDIPSLTRTAPPTAIPHLLHSSPSLAISLATTLQQQHQKLTWQRCKL